MYVCVSVKQEGDMSREDCVIIREEGDRVCDV